MSAVLSGDGLYRYRLERPDPAGLQASGKAVAFIMVNPSTADHRVDDQTIRKLIGFSSAHGLGRIIVGNKFAWRAKDIDALRTADDPIGPENDRHLEEIMREADRHIVAWGRMSKLPPHLRQRWRDVVAIADRVGCRLECLGTSLDGHPLHPLTLSYERAVVEWARPWAGHGPTAHHNTCCEGFPVGRGPELDREPSARGAQITDEPRLLCSKGGEADGGH